jgi:multidrug efflux pump subunit AcrB
MHISERTFRRKALFFFLLFCIIVGGVLSFRSISKLEDPELVVMVARVITVYPGAPAHEVEMQVTNILEEELSTLENIDNITSRSSDNLSLITVMLEMTVPQKEIEQRWDFLRRKVKAAVTRLPEGIQDPMVIDDFGDVYGMFYAMTGDGFSYQEMTRVADFIKREMLMVEGVGKVQVYGSQQPSVDIILSSEKMGELSLSPYQIIAAIQGQNATLYAGAYEAGSQLITVNISNKIASSDDIQKVRVRGFTGSTFSLSDVAEIQEGIAVPLRNTLFLNNKKAIGISLSMESGKNIIDVGKRVEKRLAELQKEIPAGYAFEKVFFQPEKVRASIDGFMKNLILSVLIVTLVIMLAMGLRSGLIIGSGLILTILATFPILLTLGGTLQRISLGAFIVAMGMLVDNAIVVMDGIVVDLQRKVDRKKAMIRSAKRTAFPLLGATIIAVAAFFPVYLSKDAAGTYAHDLFLVLCISLLISWLLSITQIPLFADTFLKLGKKQSVTHPYHGRFYQMFRRSLVFLLRHKMITLIVSGILLLIAILAFHNIKKTFFPDFNYNQVYIEYKLPEGTSPDRVTEDLHKITRHFLTFDEVKMVVTSHGMTPTRYSLVRAISDLSDSYGELIVNFGDYKTMVKMKPELNRYLRENYPDAYVRIRKYNLSIKASHTVEVQYAGPDPAVLRQLSHQAQKIMKQCQYADSYTVCDDWEPQGQALVTRYDQASAQKMGISRSEVSNALLAATQGLPVAAFFEGETKTGITLKMRESDGSPIQDLNNIPVWRMMPDVSKINMKSIQGVLYGTQSVDDITRQMLRPVPLSSVTNGISLGWNEKVVRRSDGQRTIQAQCDPLDGFSPALVRKTIREEIEKIHIPEGYSMKWVGEKELQGDALRNIFKYLPISILLIILTLILLFKDYKKPLIVLLCIPMAFIGIVPGMILTGSPFTFMAIIGSFGLMGMIIKNAIVLIDEIESLLIRGIGKYRAIIQATISRSRPVLMASFTTILGMVPLLTDPMYSSMAVAIISGLLVGTIITLIFVPVLFSAFYHITKNGTNHETFEMP